jgi:eukaryotic-like serine/threonine-protein kinase
MPNTSDRDSDPSDLEGRLLLGRFRVEKALGHGGMGEVLLARDTLLGRPVALKRLSPDGEDRMTRRRAILKEARRASQINDRRIAGIYDVLDLDDDVLLVMEYVEGMTLRQRLTQPIPIDEFWSLALQCAGAMAAAHAHGVIHRDLKPENLMVTTAGEIKVLDFGIAKRSGSIPGPTTTTTATHDLEIAGTPQYMAPEVHLEGIVDERADIFSLGVVFYEMLTGTNPFTGSNYATIVSRIVHVTPDPVRDLNPAASPSLASVVERMLAKDPAQRLSTSADVLRELNQARQNGDVPVAAVLQLPRVAPVASAPRTAWRWAAAGLGVLVAAVALVLWRNSSAVLPRDLNVAVLAPQNTIQDESSRWYVLGLASALSDRLHRHTAHAGFQMASYEDGFDKKVQTAKEARQQLGANVALIPTIERRADLLVGSWSLVETGRQRVIATRRVETPAEEPFAFYDRMYRSAAEMLRLPPDGRDGRSELGVRGSGTLRYHLQGIGRLFAPSTLENAEAAVADFEVACRTEPEAAPSWAGLARAHLRTYRLGAGAERLARADTEARHAVELNAQCADAHVALAEVLSVQKDQPGSLAEFTRAVELEPTRDELHHRIGRVYARMGQAEREIEAYRATIRQHPHWWQPHWWVAAALYRSGEVDSAIVEFQEMIRRAPLFYEGYASLGGLLVLRGDYAHALTTLQQSIALCPTRSAYDNLGTAYFNTGKADEAVDAYNQSFQFGEANYQSWLNLGEAYFWLRRRQDQATEAYTQCVRLGREEMAARAARGRPPNVMIPATLASVFPKLGQPDSARVYLAQAVAADSTNSLVMMCAALTHWQLGARERALVELRKSVDGGYPVAWLRDSPVFEEWRQVAEFKTIVGRQDPVPQSVASRNSGGSP